MAEFCLECYNKIFGRPLHERNVLQEVDLCEGCGELKPCVVAIHEFEWLYGAKKPAALKNAIENADTKKNPPR